MPFRYLPAADFLRRSHLCGTYRRSWPGYAAIWALLIQVGSAQAEVQQAELQLVWMAPIGCPSQKQVIQDAVRLAGSQQPTAGLNVTATVARLDAQHWRLVLKTNEGTRRVSAPNCQELAHATALYIALLLSPEAPQPETSTPEQVTPQEALSPPANREIRPPADSEPDRAFAELGLGADFGTLPGPDALFRLGGGVDFGDASFLMRAGVGAPRTYLVAQGLKLSLFPLHSNVGLCGVLVRAGIWSLGGCLLAEVGVFRAEPVGLESSQTRWTPWFSGGVGPRLLTQVTESLHLGVDVDAAVPLIRPNLRLDNLGPLHSPRAALRAAVFAQLVLF